MILTLKTRSWRFKADYDVEKFTKEMAQRRRHYRIMKTNIWLQHNQKNSIIQNDCKPGSISTSVSAKSNSPIYCNPKSTQSSSNLWKWDIDVKPTITTDMTQAQQQIQSPPEHFSTLCKHNRTAHCTVNQTTAPMTSCHNLTTWIHQPQVTITPK